MPSASVLGSLIEASEAPVSSVLIAGGVGLVRPFSVSATFTRPADTIAYAVGDLIANSTTAASVVPMTVDLSRKEAGIIVNRNVVITGARLIASSGSPTSLPRVVIYQTEPFSTGSYPADNTALRGATGALTLSALTNEFILGDVLSWTRAASDLSYADFSDLNIPLSLPTNGLLRILLESRNIATPTSGLTYTIALRGLH